jgi:hypothetical protein
MLHDQTSFWIKQQLFGQEGVIVADVPYHPDFDDEPEQVIKSERGLQQDSPQAPKG